MTDAEQKQAEIDLLKEMVDEMRDLRTRVEALEEENYVLTKAVDDPETLMRKHGWLKAVTPQPEETFDPLLRDIDDTDVFSGPFSGSGDTFIKSQHEQLEEWKAAERLVDQQ